MVMHLNTQKIPEHFFISFSRKDEETADRLVHDLQKEGIPVWIDIAKLIPGTPDWESEIRQAIDDSFAIVLLASPASRESRYVRGELNLAESKGCTIYPVWINGTNWADCIPLGMSYAQYIDMHENHRAQGFAELCQVLKKTIEEITPKHYLVEPLSRLVGSNKRRVTSRASPPPEFVAINLSPEHIMDWDEGARAVFMKVSAYRSIAALLDDLYLNYLKDRFMPFTYGKDWILEEEFDYPNRLLIPWSWFSDSLTSSYQLDEQWLFKTPLSQCGIEPRSWWKLEKRKPVEAVGLTVNDDRIFQVIRKNLKALYSLRARKILTEIPLEELKSYYKFRYVLSSTSSLFHSGEIDKISVLVQTDEPLPERFLNYWLSNY